MADIFDQISKMKLQDTVNLWRNAINILDNPKQALNHDFALDVIEAVGEESERRRRGPANPDDYSSWPSTDASPGFGAIDTDHWLKEGVLKFMGYKVGNVDGEPQSIRHRILSQIFSAPLPPAFPYSYLDECPSSAQRLRKMAETIAALVRNGKRRRDSQMQFAIRGWDSDLEHLYYDYYVSKFHFDWPTTAIG
jgi:hypothetical protein